MSIEKDLKDNTAALKANTAAIESLIQFKAGQAAIESIGAPVATQPAPPVVPVQPEIATPPPVAPPTQPAVAPAPAAAMSAEELNAAILVEFKRLNGDRTKIDAVMTSMSIAGITNATPEQYQPLLDAIRAIQS